jgi:hypothetical protein
MKKFNLPAFKKWCRDNQRLAEAVAAAQAHAQFMRAKVDAYTAPIYQSFGFIYEGVGCARLNERRGANTMGQPLPFDEFFLLCGKDESPEIQARVAEYHAAIDRANFENGYTDLEPGFCPALIAESLQSEAEFALLESGCEFIGAERVPYGDLRKRFLDLLMKGCISSSNETVAQQTNRVMSRLMPQVGSAA